jgi:hypothetical protein
MTDRQALLAVDVQISTPLLEMTLCEVFLLNTDGECVE